MSKLSKRIPLGVLGEIVSTLGVLGASSLFARALSIAVASFASGLAQTGLLLLISQLAVGGVERKHNLKVEGFTITVDQAILVSFGALAIYLITSLISALASSSMAAQALAAGRKKLIESFFRASWAVQSEERLGHVQQLLTVNCENIGNVILMISSGLQALLALLALLGGAFFVDPTAAALVLLFGALLFGMLQPFNKLSRRASLRLSKDGQAMATHVTEYTRLAREFRVFGVESRAIAVLEQGNVRAATSFRRSRNLSGVTPVVYQSMALAFVVAGVAELAIRSSHNLAASGAVLLLILRSLTYGSSLQSTSLQLSSYQAFLDGLREDLERYISYPRAVIQDKLPTTFDLQCQDIAFSYDGKT
jgi:ABC-type multidrug transport system fused ATPase/permease subunit